MSIFAFLGLGIVDTLCLFFVLAVAGMVMAVKSAAKSEAMQNVAGKAAGNFLGSFFKK